MACDHFTALAALAWTYEEEPPSPVLSPLFSEGYGGVIMNQCRHENPVGTFIVTHAKRQKIFLTDIPSF
jgi:hypothetical protein